MVIVDTERGEQDDPRVKSTRIAREWCDVAILSAVSTRQPPHEGLIGIFKDEGDGRFAVEVVILHVSCSVERRGFSEAGDLRLFCTDRFRNACLFQLDPSASI